jgi:hypothetical protein
MRPEVRVVNTDRRLHVFLETHCGGKAYAMARSKPNWKPAFQWVLTGQAALRLIETIRPWLVIKRAQADIVLDVPRFRTPVSVKRSWSEAEYAEAETAFAAIGVLNRRGVVAA